MSVEACIKGGSRLAQWDVDITGAIQVLEDVVKKVANWTALLVAWIINWAAEKRILELQLPESGVESLYNILIRCEILRGTADNETEIEDELVALILLIVDRGRISDQVTAVLGNVDAECVIAETFDGDDVL